MRTLSFIPRTRAVFVVAIASCLAAGLTSAHGAVLYDGALNTAPLAQGWVYFAVGVETVTGGAVTLDTTADSGLQSGYGRTGQTLNAAAGYVLSFSARLLSESHLNDDRAGFSVIAVSSATSQAIEIGFWADEVWAQGPTFTHAEGATLDTVSGFIDYDLVLQGSGYELFADDVSVLTGATRDYRSAGGPFLPYGIANSIFFGDDTTSASASFSLASVELNPVLVPEPLGVAVLGVMALGVLTGRLRGGQLPHSRD